MSQSPNRLLGIFLGIVYVIDGVYGFFLTSDTGFAATSGPKILDLFETNPLHNIVHLVIGVALVTAALIGARTSKAMNTTLGVLFLLVGIVGLLVSSGDNPLNVLAINGADNVLNFATAVVLLTVGIGGDPAAKSIAAA
jgi:purine-cytosine permease-like protein